MTTRSAKGNVVEKLVQAFACLSLSEHVFVLRLDGISHTGRSAVANRLARRPQRSIRRMRQREDKTDGFVHL
jgi:hypothetical protein